VFRPDAGIVRGPALIEWASWTLDPRTSWSRQGSWPPCSHADAGLSVTWAGGARWPPPHRQPPPRSGAAEGSFTNGWNSPIALDRHRRKAKQTIRQATEKPRRHCRFGSWPITAEIAQLSNR